jgi:DNA-binding NarL/FixJ family response regulator
MSANDDAAVLHRYEQVQDLAAQGLSNEAIAQQTNLSLPTVKNYRARSLIKMGAPLSKRELEVSELARTGLTNHAIAQKLGLSSRTVEVHRHRAMKKLGVRNAVELTVLHKNQETEELRAHNAELKAKIVELEKHIARLQRS